MAYCIGCWKISNKSTYKRRLHWTSLKIVQRKGFFGMKISNFKLEREKKEVRDKNAMSVLFITLSSTPQRTYNLRLDA